MRLLRLRLLRRLRHQFRNLRPHRLRRLRHQLYNLRLHLRPSLNLRRHLHLRPHLRRLQHQLLNLRLHLRPSLNLRLRQLHNRRQHLHRPHVLPQPLQLQRERRPRPMFRTNFCHQLCVV